MLGRMLLAGFLLVAIATAPVRPLGQEFSEWRWQSPDAYGACVAAGRPLTTDGWTESYPLVDHPVFAELGAPARVPRLVPRYIDSLQWRVGFQDGNTTIHGQPLLGEALDLSVLDRVAADLGLGPSDVRLWDEGAGDGPNGAWRTYRAQGYPDLDALLDRDASDPHINPHDGWHTRIHALAGPWEWELVVPDCIAAEGERYQVTIGPDGHGSLSGDRLDRQEALQAIRASFDGRVQIGGLSPPPGMLPS